MGHPSRGGLGKHWVGVRGRERAFPLHRSGLPETLLTVRSLSSGALDPSETSLLPAARSQLHSRPSPSFHIARLTKYKSAQTAAGAPSFPADLRVPRIAERFPPPCSIPPARRTSPSP